MNTFRIGRRVAPVLLSTFVVTAGTGAAQAVPSFLEVGKSYVLNSSLQIEVLEFGPGSWIRVRDEDDEVMWLNLNLVATIQLTPDDFVPSRERAYEAAMKSDLRNLVTAQEMYFADNTRYTVTLSDDYFVPSRGVTIEIELVGYGWRAIARSDQTATICHIVIGSDPPVEGVFEGEPYCER